MIAMMLSRLQQRGVLIGSPGAPVGSNAYCPVSPTVCDAALAAREPLHLLPLLVIQFACCRLHLCSKQAPQHPETANSN